MTDITIPTGQQISVTETPMVVGISVRGSRWYASQFSGDNWEKHLCNAWAFCLIDDAIAAACNMYNIIMTGTDPVRRGSIMTPFLSLCQWKADTSIKIEHRVIHRRPSEADRKQFNAAMLEQRTATFNAITENNRIGLGKGGYCE